jgi:hypothetical protein
MPLPSARVRGKIFLNNRPTFVVRKPTLLVKHNFKNSTMLQRIF